jgi:RNA polymerase sigma factor (sigma-70 family)
MTDLLSDVETPSDAELISRVRGGDVAAYGELFSRHKDAAQRLARQLVRGPDSDDLVSEAFAKVLSVLQGGGGPDVAFRAYLLTAVRRLHVDRVRSGQRVQTTDDLTPFDPGVPFQDTAVAGFESGAAAKAFASLPERWQLVLWHLEVEGQKPADIAPLLGMSANSVSALAYRAREGLRQAFLTMHISDLTETDCRWVNEHLGAFIRRGLSKRDAGKVQAHLDDCRRCTAMYLELTEVNSNLAGIIAPLLLGAAATGYLASTGGVGAAGVLGLLSKVKEFVGANSGAATAGGVAAGVATAAAVAVVTLGGGPADNKQVVADPPASVSTTPAAPAPSLPKTSASPDAKPSEGASASASPSASTSVTPSETTTPTAVGPAVTAPSQEQTDTPAPSDSETTGPAPVTVSTVDVSGTTVDEDGVHFRALGSPDLPPVMTVRLTSQPGGVTFAPSGDCNVAADGLSAVCSPVSGGSGGTVPGAAAAATPSSYAAELPFLIPDGQSDTDLAVDVDVPDGFEVSGGSAHLKPYTSRTADVRLALDSPVPFAPGGYAVVARLNGLPAGYAGPVRILKVEGDATITGSPTAGCAVDAGTLLCSQPADTVTVVLDAADPTQATEVRLRVAALTGYRDPTGANNASTATLEAKPVVTPDADLALTLDAPDRQGTTYSVGAHLTGVPAGYTGTVQLALTGEVDSLAAAGCTPVPLTTTLTCDVPADGALGLTITTHDAAKDRPVTIAVAPLSGYTDVRAGNNSATVTLGAEPSTDVDVALTALAPATVRPQSGDRYDMTGTVSVSGPAAAAVQDVTYTVSGAEFVTGSGTSPTVTRPASQTAPVFTLTHAGAAKVTVTASAPGFHDTLSLNDTASADLSPYDVSLTGLAPSTGTADQSGDQVFTATVHRDGFTGSLGYALVGAPADLSLTSTEAGDQVTLSVHSAKKDLPATGFTIRVALPAGFTDYASGNDNASSTYTYAATPVQPFTFSSAPKASSRVGNEWTVTATVTGVPQSGSVAFGLTSPSEFVSGTGCTVSPDRQTLTCSPGASVPLTVTFQAKLPGNPGQQHGSLSARVVGDATRTASATITE